MDISLDDYIRRNDVKRPSYKNERAENSSSKFDRYDRDSANAGVDEDENDDFMDVTMEMPRLVPIKARPQQPKQQQQRVSVHERLGHRDSVTSLDIDSMTIKLNNGAQPQRKRQNNLKRLNNQNFGRISVQHRLKKDFVNPAIVARNNFSVNAINSFMESAMKNFGGVEPDESFNQNGNLLAALATRMISTMNQNKVEKTEQKYNMTVQKEISAIQGKQLFYKCPGASVVSCDGPGLQTPVKVPHNETGMSLNQRFA